MNQNSPLVAWSNDRYLPYLMRNRGWATRQIGWITVPDGFAEFQNLVHINSIFSSEPKGSPIDRTNSIKTPLRYSVSRPWQRPTDPLDIEQALQMRVEQIENLGHPINLMWSGGIDSTGLTNAFLAFSKDLRNLRVLYSPFSRYEHPEYLDLLRKKNVEAIDISGTVYLNTFFDGIFVTGDSGDETQASVDESFIDAYGYHTLSEPWKDFFWQQNPNQHFMDFCEKYFTLSGMPIQSVLDARWWFYINSKIHCIWAIKLQLWCDYPNFHPGMVVPFFDCEPWERYVTFNRDKIMPEDNYRSWKTDLKNFSLRQDGLVNYHANKKKITSMQLQFYNMKKRVLKHLHSLMILEDGSRVFTDNLPLFSHQEFFNKYHNSLEYLWNDPD